MKNIKDELNREKIRLEQLHIPENFEDRLGKVMNEKTKNRRKGINKFVTSRNGLVAAVLFMIIFIGIFNYDTLAYYGSNLVGYDELMSSSLKQINEENKGQIIDKSYTFSDGMVVNLDGIMIDSNKLIAFYSIKLTKEDYENKRILSPSLKWGNFELNRESGSGTFYEEDEEMRWMQEFEPPKFFQNSLKLSFTRVVDGKREEGEIKFKIDRKKAMTPKFKLNINEEIDVEGTKVKINSIIATPMSTLVKGKIRGTIGVALDHLKGEKKPITGIEVALYGDGEPIRRGGGHFSTGNKGDSFEIEFDALPEKINVLEVVIEKSKVNIPVSVDEKLLKGEESNITIEGNEITIEKVYEKGGNTYVTLTSEDGVLLSEVYLNIDGKNVELERTFGGDLEKNLIGESKVKITHTRTLQFNGIGAELELSIRMITFNKKVDERIEFDIVD